MKTRFLLAMILIVLGFGYLLDSLDIWNFSHVISSWWPLFVIGAGVINISKKHGSFTVGIILIAIGVLLQASELQLLPGGFWATFWPLLFITIGVLILTRVIGKNRHAPLDDDKLNIFNFFSGNRQVYNSSNFKGGEISVMFGGTELDLRQASTSNEGAILDITAAFGGVEIFVPRDWNIISQGTPFLGGFDNKTHQNVDNTDKSPTLTIRYFVAFGGIDVKN